MAGRISKEALLKITGDSKDAEEKLKAVSAQADELERKHPELKPRIDKAEALAQAAILREDLKRILKTEATVEIKPKVSVASKLLGFLTGGIKGTNPLAGGSGILGTIGSGGLPAILGVATALAALLPLIVGVASGLAAAATGIGAFGLLALPTLNKIKNSYTNISTAQQGVVSAQKAYTDAVEKNKLDPTKTNATAVAAALLKVKVAQEDLANASKGPGGVVTSIQSLIRQFDQMAQAFQPTALLVINDALRIAHTLLPDLEPFARTAGGAIDELLKKVNTFFQSADFAKWLDSFNSLVGPAIGAIGTGVGKVAVSFGKLLTVLPPADVVRSIGIAFDVVNTSLEILTGTVQVILGPLRTLAGLINFITGSGGNYQGLGSNLAGAGGLAGKNFSGLGSLPSNPAALPVLVPPPPGIGPGGGKTHQLSATPLVAAMSSAIPGGSGSGARYGGTGLYIRAAGDEVSQLIAALVRRYAQAYGGGNVQKAFGTG